MAKKLDTMRIGIDALILDTPRSGSFRYFELFLDSLASVQTENEYIVFTSKATQKAIASISHPSLRFQTTDSVSWLPAALRQQMYRAWQAPGKLNLLHSLLFVPPLAYAGKTVMTLFDMVFMLYPNTKKWTGRWWWRIFGPAGIKKADRVIAISASTRRDACRLLNIPERKVDVIYPYLPSYFHPIQQPEDVLRRYGVVQPYLLHVGTLERRKNLTTLLHAYAQVIRDDAIQHNLVLVGQPGWLYKDIFQTVEQLDLKEKVIFLHHVPDADLPALYSAADLFVFLSIYEGFGLPVLEAMSCGTPVLCSNASSLPEVAGDAGILVNPSDVEQITDAMQRILLNQGLRQELSQLGLLQASRFNRQQFTQQTLAVYQQVLSTSA